MQSKYISDTDATSISDLANELFECTPEAILLIDTQSIVHRVNKEFTRLFQYTEKEIKGRNIDQILARGTGLAEAVDFMKLVGSSDKVSLECIRYRKDGTLLNVSILGVPIRLGNGELAIYAIYRDITQREKAEILQKRRIDFIEFISQISSDFINLPIFEIDTAIERALQFAALSSEVERGYILLLNQESNKLELTHEWFDETVLPRKGLFGHFESGYSLDLTESLSQGKLVKVQRIEIVPTIQNRMTNEMLDLLKVKSFILIPFSVHEKNIGYIGFDATRQQIDWTDELVEIFKLTGKIIANAIHRKKYEQELTWAKEKAEESDKLKTAFLASISREIRSPVNHIMQSMELLNNAGVNALDRQEFFNIIHASGDSLLRLIDDIIDIAKIESNQIEVKEEIVSIHKFLNDIHLAYQNVIPVEEKSKLTIELNRTDQQPLAEIITDPKRLQQILNNLLSNAIKFTNKGKIIFGCKLQSNNRLMFFVSDTGIGIPKEKIGFIFERFRQLDLGPARASGGTGLGLAISKGLIEVLGGELWVESEVNVGTKIFFTIPYKPLVAQPEITVKSIDTDKIDWSDKNILIVEDDELNAKFLRIILSKTNARLFNAINGQEAVDMARETAFDLILMDIQIPIIDGYEATRLIKSFSPATTIIAQTAHAMTDERSNCLKAGCNDYLSKPINRKELLNKILLLFNKG